VPINSIEATQLERSFCKRGHPLRMRAQLIRTQVLHPSFVVNGCSSVPMKV
jgi:hypothetical protein